MVKAKPVTIQLAKKSGTALYTWRRSVGVQIAEDDTAQDAMLARRIEDAASPVGSPPASAADISGAEGNWTECAKLEFCLSCASWTRLSKERSRLMRFIGRLAHCSSRSARPIVS